MSYPNNNGIDCEYVTGKYSFSKYIKYVIITTRLYMYELVEKTKLAQLNDQFETQKHLFEMVEHFIYANP